MISGAERAPALLAATDEPIVSSDVIGCRQSLLFDLKATLKSGQKMVKTIGWYESLGHACRIIDVVRAYANLQTGGQ